MGRKLKNMRLNWFEKLRQFFCPIRNVLENHDLGKRHTMWEKLNCPLKFFLAGTPMSCPMYHHPNGVRALSVVDKNLATWLIETCPAI